MHQAVSMLRSQKFSFIIDEATDLSTSKQLAILTTYFDMDAFETKHYLVDMVEVEAGTAEGIYSSVKNTFTELFIPMENIIGKHHWLFIIENIIGYSSLKTSLVIHRIPPT